MNDDHLDAIANYARHFARVDSAGWSMTGLDIEGFDIVAGDEARRIFFPSPLKDAREMREMLVAMAKEAREAVQP